jgi:hypothetical protein
MNGSAHRQELVAGLATPLNRPVALVLQAIAGPVQELALSDVCQI